MASKSLEISAEDVRVIGLCTGSLAASAFCCTITLDDLHRIAIPIVCVAFQVGILAASAASASYQQDGYEAKWSCAFAHVSESRMEDLLEEFHTNVSWLSLVLMPSYYLISSRFKLERALVTIKNDLLTKPKAGCGLTSVLYFSNHIYEHHYQWTPSYSVEIYPEFGRYRIYLASYSRTLSPWKDL
jgi:hypothetical protein